MSSIRGAVVCCLKTCSTFYIMQSQTVPEEIDRKASFRPRKYTSQYDTAEEITENVNDDLHPTEPEKNEEITKTEFDEFCGKHLLHNDSLSRKSFTDDKTSDSLSRKSFTDDKTSPKSVLKDRIDQSTPPKSASKDMIDQSTPSKSTSKDMIDQSTPPKSASKDMIDQSTPPESVLKDSMEHATPPAPLDGSSVDVLKILMTVQKHLSDDNITDLNNTEKLNGSVMNRLIADYNSYKNKTIGVPHIVPETEELKNITEIAHSTIENAVNEAEIIAKCWIEVLKGTTASPNITKKFTDNDMSQSKIQLEEQIRFFENRIRSSLTNVSRKIQPRASTVPRTEVEVRINNRLEKDKDLLKKSMDPFLLFKDQANLNALMEGVRESEKDIDDPLGGTLKTATSGTFKTTGAESLKLLSKDGKIQSDESEYPREQSKELMFCIDSTAELPSSEAYTEENIWDTRPLLKNNIHGNSEDAAKKTAKHGCLSLFCCCSTEEN